MIKNIINYIRNNSGKIFIVSLIIVTLIPTIFFLTHKENIYINQDINSNQNINFEKLNSEKNYKNDVIKPNIDSKNKNNFILKFKFKPSNNDKFENLFQTDDYNFGARLEYYNNDLSLITADGKSYKVWLFNTKVYPNKTYEFKINAIDNYGFFAELDGDSISYYSLNFTYKLGNFLLGQGFDDGRKFSGEISDISYLVRNIEKPIVLKSYLKKYFSEISFLLLFFLLYFASLALLYIYQHEMLFFRRLYKVCNYFYLKYRIFFIITIVLILFYLFSVYFNFILVYIILFFIGLGLFVTVIPKYYRDDNYCLFISPILGLIMVTIVGGYIITFSLNIGYLVAAALFYSTIIFLISSKRSEIFYLLNKTVSDLNNHALYYIFIPFFIVLILLLPNVIYPNTSFYRIGPDLSLYAKMTQFLFDGGTLSEARLRASEFTNLSVGDINRYGDASATWPFMYYFRWGFSAFQNFIIQVTPVSHVFQISFFSLIFSHLALVFSAFYWLKKRFNFSPLISVLAGLAILLNINILNLWFEGFYANSFSLFIFILLLSLFFWNHKHKKEDHFSSIPLITVLFIAALLTYPEGILFVLGPLIVLTAALELLVLRKLEYTKYFVLMFSFLIALVLIWPCGYIYDWAIIIIKQLSEEGGNGFMQPHWALPHEIFGIYNIYSDISGANAGAKLPRSIINYLLSAVLTAYILYLLIVNFLKNYKKIYPVLYAPFILVGIIAIYVFLTSRENNYMYMKYYVFLSPILIIYFWASVNYFINKKNINKKYKNFIFITITSIIFTNGLLYVAKYSYQATHIEDKQITLYKENKENNFSNAIIYPYQYSGILYSYASTLKTSWLIPYNFKIKYHKNNLNKNLCIFLENKEFTSENKFNFEKINKSNIVFLNNDFLIYDTKLPLSNFIDNENNSIIVEKIENIMNELTL